jgi:hypothetical protein
MKKIQFILLLVLSVACKAQNSIVPLLECDKVYDHTNPDYYLKDTTNEMNKYEGTWQWIDGNRKFWLTLIKQKHHFNQTGNDNYYEDRLVGYYKYWENGVLIADTSSDNLSKDYGIRVQFGMTCSGQVSSIAFRDYKKFKEFSVYLDILSPTQIKIEMLGKEHITTIQNGLRNPFIGPQDGSTFPMEMVLIKL